MINVEAYAAAKAWSKRNMGAQAQLVATVTNGSSMPTQRATGAALMAGDFVMPKTSSTFPFTTADSKATFNNKQDVAVWSGIEWLMNAHTFQKSNEVTLANKATESISGTANYQSDVNVETKAKFDTKLDKSTATVSLEHAYIHKADGTDSLMQINTNANAGLAIVRRDLDKQINVPLAPLGDDDATSKKYVDDALANKVDKSTDVTVLYGTDASGIQILKSYTVAKSSNSVMLRDNAGRSEVGTPTANDHATNKAYVDVADTVLSNALTTETTNRTTADTALQTALTNETSARTSADTALQTNISTEATTRSNADTALQSTIGAHTARIDNPHNVTKSQVGLGNVDNTSDINKPISTATQTALDAEILARTNADTTETTARETKDDDLQDQINNLSSMGRYLSTWNCVTGKPATEPTTPLPYTYKAGDYYIINGIGVTNYRPSGTQYTGVASTTVETSTIANNGYYQFDGATWIYLEHTAKAVGFKDLTGTARENTDLKNELNAKQDTLTASSNITIDADNKISAKDTTYSAGDALEIDSDNKIGVKDNGITKSKIDSSANVVYTNDMQTLTNKTIDADDNTVTDLTGANLKTYTAAEKGKTWLLQADGTWALSKVGSDVDGTTIGLNESEQIELKNAEDYLKKTDITHDAATGVITFNF